MADNDWLERLAAERQHAERMHIRALKDRLRIEAAMYRLQTTVEDVRRVLRGLSWMPPEDQEKPDKRAED